ncbi:MAG: polysaccharide biosynthesis C-terminal domain-containing protein, partial [Actinobacteria bacterium]|nr:polysaccharide biosynthesis C-terminal domain-containing protein [Actinomycetota bacterium]
MRLLRRNALGVYAVYAAAIVSGLVVTPVVIHSIGKSAFGVWTFIGAVTIYLSVLDFGVGPSIVRFGAEARGRGATRDLNEIASTGLAIYAAIGLITLPIGIGLAALVPLVSPSHLGWDAAIATLLVVLSLAARFPLGLFNNLLVAQQRWDLQNLANFISTALYGLLVAVLMPRYGGLVLLGALTLGTTLLRLALPLLWLKRELPELQIHRRFVSRARLRELLTFSSSNFLVHVAQKIVFSTDVIVVAIVLGSSETGVYSVPAKLFALAFGIGTAVTSLMFPAFAELEGAGAGERQRRLLLSGLRAGTALMLLLALPLLLIPDLLIRAWIQKPGYEGGYPVMSILAAVLLIHQPIYVLTQFLIARARQREVAIVSIVTTLANLGLSFLLAWVWGIWGVAASTLVTDAAALAYIVPRYAAPAAGTTAGALFRAIARPAAPAMV